jgi:hypothetical protein
MITFELLRKNSVSRQVRQNKILESDVVKFKLVHSIFRPRFAQF